VLKKTTIVCMLHSDYRVHVTHVNLWRPRSLPRPRTSSSFPAIPLELI